MLYYEVKSQWGKIGLAKFPNSRKVERYRKKYPEDALREVSREEAESISEKLEEESSREDFGEGMLIRTVLKFNRGREY